MSFVLIRHGETDWNVRNLFQGSTDIALNDTGRAQARAAGDVLACRGWDVIVSSSLSRAAETADVIAARVGLARPQRYRTLIERDYGTLEGRPVCEYGPQDGPDFAGCEPEAAVADRALATLAELALIHRGDRVLVVAHGTLIRLTLQRLLGSPVERIHNAALNVIDPVFDAEETLSWRVRIINGSPVLEQMTETAASVPG